MFKIHKIKYPNKIFWGRLDSAFSSAFALVHSKVHLFSAFDSNVFESI